MKHYYQETRLTLSTPGEFFVRLISHSAYIILIVVAGLLLFSKSESLLWPGLLFALFLIDRLLHIGQGDESIRALAKGGNFARVCTPETYKLINNAYRRSLLLHHNLHLALIKELLEHRGVITTLRRLSVDTDAFSVKVQERFNNMAHEEEAMRSDTDQKKRAAALLESIGKIMLRSYGSAVRTGGRFIEPQDIFASVVAERDESLAKLFDFFELTVEGTEEAIIFGKWHGKLSGFKRLPAVLGGFVHRPGFLRARPMNRAWTARPTATLDQFSTDLTALARRERAGFLIGHEKEVEHLLNILARPGKPNAILVGEPGVGKSSIIAHIAFRMAKDDVPHVLFDKRLISLDVPSLLANASPEILAGRLNDIVNEILTAGNIVLMIPNAHDLFRSATTKAASAIDILLPVLRSDMIPTIAETYPREFKQLIESRTDFLDQFEIVDIKEISEREAVRFLIYASLILEREYKIFITFSALRKAVTIARRYFPTKMLPGSALDLVRQALAKAQQEKKKALNDELIVAVAERQSKIPIEHASKDEADKLLNLEALIHERLINQNIAVSAVSRALREYRSGLSRKGGPIASFLFVGPTGVGKTELAKILTAIQFGSKNLMHRFDMSEYQDKQSISRFIGTPDGEMPGALTDAVLQSPYSLVLFDEFEKAHPDILNLFLQVLDDGRLTDNRGRTANFENTIVIATSNAHSNYIKEQIEKGNTVEAISETLTSKLTEYFKPELLNRFSGIVVFRNLTVTEIEKIAALFIREVANTLLESHGVALAVDELATRKIAELGYSPVFGARPLRQVVSEQIRSVLAEKILRKEIVRGASVRITYEGEKFVWVSEA